MRKTARSFLFFTLVLLSTVALALSAMVTSAGFSLAATTALVMGGTGRPNPADFPGYMENVGSYYIAPNTGCKTFECLVPVTTPETAWPLYGGPDALTWRDSILQGVKDLDAEVQPRLSDLSESNKLVIFGYSQSGAIIAFEKAALAQQLTPLQQQFLDFVIIGDVSRPNGGLNGRANGFSIPIVNFPFGPSVPTDTGMKTTDIAMKWDIIADAPLYVTNPIAMLNALLGFEYVHGTYPDPTQASPNSTPGGYTVEQWQKIMNDPEGYAKYNPDLINVQQAEGSDTKYVTITPTVLPLVAPLHQIGLTPLANLIEPALRVLVEETGYDRSIPYGQPTPFRLIPVFNPIKLAIDLVLAIPQGITNMINGLQGKPTYPLIDPPADTTVDNLDNTQTVTTTSALRANAAVQQEQGVQQSQEQSNSTARSLNLVQDNKITTGQLGTDNSQETHEGTKPEQMTPPQGAVESDEQVQPQGAAGSLDNTGDMKQSGEHKPCDDKKADTKAVEDKQDDKQGTPSRHERQRKGVLDRIGQSDQKDTVKTSDKKDASDGTGHVSDHDSAKDGDHDKAAA